jgi:FkbM family methyltransferase
MWDFKTIVKDFIETKDFQEFINNRFKSDSKLVISKKYFKDFSNGYKYLYIAASDDEKFYFDETFSSIYEDYYDYSIEDMRKTDVVLDIGANNGGFSLRVASKVKHVYAVEPLFTDIAKKNIELNNVNNITVFDCGLGDGEMELKYGDRTKKVKCLPLTEIIKQCGGHIDFLKFDCEGGEWSIKPEELQGIRRIEAEIHHLKDMPHFSEFEDTLKKAGFDYEKEILSKELMLIHASQQPKT